MKRYFHFLLALMFTGLTLSGCAHGPQSPVQVKVSAESATGDYVTAIRRGADFLVKTQNPDGSWGTGIVSHGNEVESMVPGSHDAFRVGTTALCVMALRQTGRDDARAKGVEYLIRCGQARRDNGMLLYNIWANIYALQALSIEMRYNNDPRIAGAARWNLDRLQRYATYVGGWNYYDFKGRTKSVSMEPESFSTAAGLVALWEARRSGLEVPQRLIDISLQRLEECRQPTGVYLYSNSLRYKPRMPGNLIPGAIGRTQPSNYALWLWTVPTMSAVQARQGLDLFFKYHQALEMGRQRPYPHESWYQTSGYYYYFDHYYAGLLVKRMNDPELARRLGDFVLPHQEADGSWWDYPMWDYHKPYGTAFAIMTLKACE